LTGEQARRKDSKRVTIYLALGLAAGVAVMALPALIHLLLGPASPMADSYFGFTPNRGYETPPPGELLAELLWLLIPALAIALILYWLATRRAHWSSHRETLKWSRH